MKNKTLLYRVQESREALFKAYCVLLDVELELKRRIKHGTNRRS